MMINKSGTKKEKGFDTDIVQCKADILRAKDVMPPYNKKQSENTASSVDANEPNPIPVEMIDSEKTAPLPVEKVIPFESAEPPKDTKGKENAIPRFDLAEELMAEQRSITAIRRTSPSKKSEAQKPQADSNVRTMRQLTLASSEQEQIIAEIVARDIERLCSGAAFDDQEQNLNANYG